MDKPGLFIFGSLFSAMFALVGISEMVSAIKLYIEFKRSINWQKVNADLIDCKIHKRSGGRGTPNYWAEIEYEYIVGNYIYKGDKIAFGYDNSQAENFHKELFEKLEQKKQVTIWYDPLSIDNSVLIKKISSSCISSFAGGCLFFLFSFINSPLYFLIF